VSDLGSLVLVACASGIVGGLWLLLRGMGSYRRAATVADVSTSRISSLAMGEVRLAGRVEAAELTLVSPLQSRTCVYFRASVVAAQGRSSRTLYRDERSVGFLVRDDSGTIRVFPRGAEWDVPDALHDHDGLAGEPPPDLAFRAGPAYQVGKEDEAELVAQLLTVHVEPSEVSPLDRLAAGGSRRYEEARIEVGDLVTIVGTALPFDQLTDPADAAFGDVAVGGPLAATDDPEIASDLAAATATGDARGRSREGLGQRRDRGLRDRQAGPRPDP